MMMAQATGLKAHEFVHTLSDAHIYLNHIEQAKLQMTREPKPLPKLILNPEIKNIFDFKFEDLKLEGYDPHPAIKADVGV
jgi:thymidylate synthase